MSQEDRKFKGFFRPKLGDLQKKKKKKKKKKGLRQNSVSFFGRSPKFKRFFRPKLGDLQKKKGLRQNSVSIFGRNPKFKRFFRPKLGDLQKKKKKKRSSPKFRAIFHPISQVQTFEGGLFSYGGGYFPFFTENRPQKHKKHAFLHTSQANFHILLRHLNFKLLSSQPSQKSAQ